MDRFCIYCNHNDMHHSRYEPTEGIEVLMCKDCASPFGVCVTRSIFDVDFENLVMDIVGNRQVNANNYVIQS